MHAVTNVRPSPLAGQWYPADPEKLAHSIDAYLTRAQVSPLEGKLHALVAPHAGHRFSGSIAGHAFAALRGSSPDLVVILSPMHQPTRDSLLTTAHRAYHTPLGDVEVDQNTLHELGRLMREETGTAFTAVEHDQEHAVEIELPFLQRVLQDGFQFIPIMIRDQDPTLMQALGHTLGDFLAETNCLYIASTDLSHFHTAEKAQKLDQTIIDAITALDADRIYEAEEKKQGFACGKGALAAALWAAKRLGANHGQLLKYGHSGEVTGDNSRVVGYAAAAVTEVDPSPSLPETQPSSSCNS